VSNLHARSQPTDACNTNTNSEAARRAQRYEATRQKLHEVHQRNIEAIEKAIGEEREWKKKNERHGAQAREGKRRSKALHGEDS